MSAMSGTANGFSAQYKSPKQNPGGAHVAGKATTEEFQKLVKPQADNPTFPAFPRFEQARSQPKFRTTLQAGSREYRVTLIEPDARHLLTKFWKRSDDPMAARQAVAS